MQASPLFWRRGDIPELLKGLRICFISWAPSHTNIVVRPFRTQYVSTALRAPHTKLRLLPTKRLRVTPYAILTYPPASGLTHEAGLGHLFGPLAYTCISIGKQ